MTIMQTIEEQIAEVLSSNDLYNRYRPRWEFLLESYLGGEEYRRGNHLTRYVNETEYEYAQRLNSTHLDNHCASVISVYNSFMFRENPERDFSAWGNRADVEDFLTDCDYDNRSLDAFMKDVSTWTAVFGHAWIVLTKPNIGAVTAADELAAGVRPYVNLITPLVTLDWSYSRSINGRYTLDYLKYIEETNASLRTVKEWTPDWIRTVTIDLDDRNLVEDVWEENGLGLIPAVLAYNRRSSVRGIGISDISDIADAQRTIYNCNSEIEQSIRLDSHPSLVKTPETEAGIGAGSVIHMPDNLDPGLRPYALEFSGAEVSSIINNVNNIVATIDKMANTGGVRATESRVLSGVAMETEFQLLNAKLSEKADNLELAEENLWYLFGLYQGLAGKPRIEYPGSFNIRDNQGEMDQLVKARNTATDPAILRVVDARILELLDEDPALYQLVLPEAPAPASPSLIATDRRYPDGTPYDSRLPEAYGPATGEQLCKNCAYYNYDSNVCSRWNGASVRWDHWCAVWQGYEEEALT